VDQGYTALSVGSGALSPLTLNDTSSIVQHDNTDCKQFEGVVEQGLSEPRNDVCVENAVQHDDTTVNSSKVKLNRVTVCPERSE